MNGDDRTLPAPRSAGWSATPSPPPSGDLVRCGAEIVALSERFYRGIFVGGLIFVGMAGIAALVFLPLRESDSSYATDTVVATAILVLAVPVAVWRAGALYRLLKRRRAAQLVVVLFAAALVAHPLHSELWWPSCALVMLVATLVPLRVALAYCLIVLLANLAAHALEGDLGHAPPETIIGLWIGFLFWSSAFAVFTERFASYVLRLNAPSESAGRPPLRVHVQGPDHPRTGSSHPRPPENEVSLGEPVDDRAPTPPRRSSRLTARQLQVVALLADGLRYDEVAACLAISERQVQRHVSNAVRRLAVRNGNELVAVAVADGIVPRREE